MPSIQTDAMPQNLSNFITQSWKSLHPSTAGLSKVPAGWHPPWHHQICKLPLAWELPNLFQLKPLLLSKYWALNSVNWSQLIFDWSSTPMSSANTDWQGHSSPWTYIRWLWVWLRSSWFCEGWREKSFRYRRDWKTFGNGTLWIKMTKTVRQPSSSYASHTQNCVYEI